MSWILELKEEEIDGMIKLKEQYAKEVMMLENNRGIANHMVPMERRVAIAMLKENIAQLNKDIMSAEEECHKLRVMEQAIEKAE